MRPFILAVDFDETIAKQEKDLVPRVLLPNSKEVINWAHDNGCYVILWTCRRDDALIAALDFLKKQNVNYDTVNDNCPGFETSRKIYADFYVDDKSFEIDWLEIKKTIRKRMINKSVKEIAEEIEQLVKVLKK